MDNSQSQVTLDTRNRTMVNNTNKKYRKLKGWGTRTPP